VEKRGVTTEVSSTMWENKGYLCRDKEVSRSYTGDKKGGGGCNTPREGEGGAFNFLGGLATAKKGTKRRKSLGGEWGGGG